MWAAAFFFEQSISGKVMVTTKFEAVKCQACGRITRRQARQQKFCSHRCRDYARAKIKPVQRLKMQDSGKPTNPRFLPNKNNGLQSGKSGSSIPLNVLGGHRLAECCR